MDHSKFLLMSCPCRYLNLIKVQLFRNSVKISFLFYNFFFSEYSCPIEYIKCKDGLQCVHKYSYCGGPSGRRWGICNDGSSNDPDICKGEIIFFSEYSCPLDYVKCRDGLQCMYKYSVCGLFSTCK